MANHDSLKIEEVVNGWIITPSNMLEGQYVKNTHVALNSEEVINIVLNWINDSKTLEVRNCKMIKTKNADINNEPGNLEPSYKTELKQHL